MIIELYINGKIAESWHYDDINYGYSEIGSKKSWHRVESLIEEIEQELSEVIKDYDYQFAVVYQSKMNYWSLKEVFAEHLNQEA